MLLSLVLLACLADAAAADARRRPSRPHHHHEGWHDRWENRRDARRAGVLTGIIVSGVAGAAARSEAEQRYRECLYATGYDYECDRRRYYDDMRARRVARRSGAAAGAVAWGIVRD